MRRTLTATLVFVWMCLLPVAGQITPVAACDIPVAEYALLNWPRDDYGLYYLHDGTEATAESEANELLRKLAQGNEGHANLRFTALNTADRPETLTPNAQYVLKLNQGLAMPRHVLISPKGRTVFSGPDSRWPAIHRGARFPARQ